MAAVCYTPHSDAIEAPRTSLAAVHASWHRNCPHKSVGHAPQTPHHPQQRPLLFIFTPAAGCRPLDQANIFLLSPSSPLSFKGKSSDCRIPICLRKESKRSFIGLFLDLSLIDFGVVNGRELCEVVRRGVASFNRRQVRERGRRRG
jgi:hypothetical protein